MELWRDLTASAGASARDNSLFEFWRLAAGAEPLSGGNNIDFRRFPMAKLARKAPENHPKFRGNPC